MKADGILDYKPVFDLDQPTDYLGQIRPKGVSVCPT